MIAAWDVRFWPKVNRTDTCWLWIASVNERGYAQFNGGDRTVDAARFLYQKLKGALPVDVILIRSCGNRRCVNPDHLRQGQRKELVRGPVEDRFWSKVIKTPTCWLWHGRITPFGYGAFFFDSKDRPAHRVSWIIANGPITGDLDVCHRCDVPACVRPDHLFLGTAHDNIMDCERKGRAVHPRGEHAGKAKLTERQVLAIRALYVPHVTSLTKLARIFRVTTQCIFAIVHRITWRHLP